MTALRCEDIRDLLPELAESRPRAAGSVEEHLVGCSACARELAAYREILGSLATVRMHDLDPSPEFLTRTLRTVRVAAWTDRMPSLQDVRLGGARVLTAVRSSRKLAIASIGGAAVGVTAIGLVWWRVAKRAVEAGAVPA